MNKMHLLASIREGFVRYFEFGGKTSRATFWDWVLFVFLANVLAAILDALFFGRSVVNFGLLPGANTPALGTIVVLALLIPNITMIVRRLRDAGFSPWWALLLVLPGIGVLALLVMSTRRGPEDKAAAEIFQR